MARVIGGLLGEHQVVGVHRHDVPAPGAIAGEERLIPDRLEEIAPPHHRQDVALLPEAQEDIADHVLGVRAGEVPNELGEADGLPVAVVEQRDQVVRGDEVDDDRESGIPGKMAARPEPASRLLVTDLPASAVRIGVHLTRTVIPFAIACAITAH
jgi:hypothetical protein